MTLPATGAITLNNVNTELARASGASINMNDATLRVLFGKDTLASQISMSDGYSKNYPIISWRGQSNSVSSLTTYTFNNVDIGTPTSDRFVAVGVIGATTVSSKTVSSISIAGTNGTIVGKNISSLQMGTWAIRNVTTGTTGTISVTFSGAGAACAIGVFALYGVSTTTPRDNESNTSTSLTLSSTVGDVTAPVLGDISLVLAGAAGLAASVTTAITLSGGTPTLTEHSDVGVTGFARIGYYSSILTGTTSQTYTLSNGLTDGKRINSVILWGYNT